MEKTTSFPNFIWHYTCVPGEIGIRGSKDLRAEIGKFPNSTNERKYMSKKTMKQRIALVAVSALTAGLFSVVSAPTANAAAELTATASSSGLTTTGIVVALSSGAGTMTTSGQLSLAVAAGTGVSNTTITGGTFTSLTSGGVINPAGTAVAATSTVALVGLIAKPTGVGVMIIKTYDGATTTSAISTQTWTVVAAANIGTFSSSKSFIAGVTTAASAAHATNVDVAYSLQAANGGEAIIAFSLKDANNINMPTSTVITASATNGAVVAFASASQLGISATTTYQGTFNNIYVAQGTKYAAIDTVVTLSVDGVVYASKAIALQGDVTKITLSDNVVGKLGQSTSNAYYTTMTDALGHKIGGLTTSIDATQFNTSVTTAAAATTTANTGAATSALFTCGTVAGKTNVKVTYTNPASFVKITSNALDLTCGGTPYTWSASLDKASYVAGDIATVTISAKDITGAIVNDIDTMGANITITGSQLTAVVTPVTGDTFTSGVKKYTYLVGSTSGSYNAVVSIPAWTGGTGSSSPSQAAATIKYAVASDGSVSNAEVLKSIVALIASINKQIAALQKLILARR